MFLKEGMYVKVREDLEIDEAYNGVWFTHNMTQYRGQTFKIRRIEGVVFLEDVDWWVWDSSMLIAVEPPNAKEAKARLKTAIFGVGNAGDIIATKEYNGVIYLTKDHLPMRGALSTDEAEEVGKE